MSEAGSVNFKGTQEEWNALVEKNKKEQYDLHVKEVKALRQDFDATLQRMKHLPSSREVSLSITNVQQGIMWLGMELKRLGEANPYPNSYDPSNTKIEPTADNLKL
jgi:hypothetical protein